MKTPEDILTNIDSVSDGWQSTYEYKEVLKAMNEYADQFKPGWLSVQEILPKNDVEVLVFSEGEFAIGKLTNKCWISKLRFYDGTNELKSVTHWMPLVQPSNKE